MTRRTKRVGVVVALGAVAALGGVAFGEWRDASRRDGQKYAEPFRIAGNLYFVGDSDVTAFLLTGPEGYVLIDGGYLASINRAEAHVRALLADAP